MFPTDVVIVAGARTAMTRYNGEFAGVTAIDLGVVAAKEAVKRANVDPGEIEHVVFGNVMQTSADAIYGARHVGLKAGLKIETPAVTVNRLCGSGVESISQAAQRILLGEAKTVLAGGMENMTQCPHVIRGARTGFRLGEGKLEDSLMSGLYDPISGCTMSDTAENLAVEHGKGKKAHMVAQDDHRRPETTMEILSALPPAFRKDGIVTAGNASGIVDGAAAVVLAQAKIAKDRGWKPLGRIVSWATAGVEPKLMGIGPVPSTRKALELAGLTLDQIDLIEVNEAFSPQYLAVEKVLGLNRDKTNVNGGAIALGHPLGATGTRLILTLLLELRRRNQRYGLATACIGGGQGIAMIVESMA